MFVMHIDHHAATDLHESHSSFGDVLRASHHDDESNIVDQPDEKVAEHVAWLFIAKAAAYWFFAHLSAALSKATKPPTTAPAVNHLSRPVAVLLFCLSLLLSLLLLLLLSLFCCVGGGTGCP